MLLKETLDQLPNASTWYAKMGYTPIRVEKRDWRASPLVVCNEGKVPIKEFVEYYEFRVVRTFNDDFDWELVR